MLELENFGNVLGIKTYYNINKTPLSGESAGNHAQRYPVSPSQMQYPLGVTPEARATVDSSLARSGSDVNSGNLRMGDYKEGRLLL